MNFIRRVSIFFVSIGVIAAFGPFFGLMVRGTDPSDNTFEIGFIFIAIGLVMFLISKAGIKK
jgi:hypothetical protein